MLIFYIPFVDHVSKFFYYYGFMLNWQNEKSVSAKSISTQKKKPFISLKNGIFVKNTYLHFGLEAPRKCAQQGVRNVSFSENFAQVLNEWFSPTFYQMLEWSSCYLKPAKAAYLPFKFLIFSKTSYYLKLLNQLKRFVMFLSCIF